MLSPVALATLFVGGIYVFLALYTLASGTRGRNSAVLAFSMQNLGLALVSAAGVVAIGASEDVGAHRALLDTTTRVSHIGLVIIFVGVVEFNASFVAAPAWVTKVTYLTAFAAVLLTLTPWTLADTLPEPSVMLYDGPGHWIAAPTLLTSAFALLIGVLVAISTSYAFRAWHHSSDPDEAWEDRLVALSTIPTLMVSTHDALLCGGGLGSRLCISFGALPVIMAVAYVFLRRAARTSFALQQHTVALRRAQKELRSTQRRLIRREELAAVGELSAVIAHEVRNPLAVIKNAVAGLRRNNLRESDQTTLLEILGEETQRLNRIMHDLLAYARPVTPQRRDLDARSLLKRVVARVVSSKIELSYDVPTDAKLSGDPELLRHAFVNVVENSVQAMPEGGLLRITVKELMVDGGPMAEVTFADSGHGMESAVLAKAQAPFYTTRPSGTGLGHAIVERIVRSHGGYLQLESERGKGTTARVLLPVRVGAEDGSTSSLNMLAEEALS